MKRNNATACPLCAHADVDVLLLRTRPRDFSNRESLPISEFSQKLLFLLLLLFFEFLIVATFHPGYE